MPGKIAAITACVNEGLTAATGDSTLRCPPRYRLRERTEAIMHRHRLAGLGALVVVVVASTSACDRTAEPLEPEEGALAALQARGQRAAGVDRHTSTHLFDALADGGRIELQRRVDDPAVVDRIRHHLRESAKAFASGDFSRPAFVHMRQIPGMAVMAERRDRIEYVYRDLPHGGELRLVTNDPDAIRAIHEFVGFLREHHRAGGMDHRARDHAAMPHGRAGQ
jgi:hypothetical protein